MQFILPDLLYAYDALEPYIDTTTMQIHHDKHHAAYVEKLNNAISGVTKLSNLSIEELISDTTRVPVGKKDIIKNNGGGHANHSFFWEIMTPVGNNQVSKSLISAINSQFGSVDKCKAEVTDAALSHFGSGWAWLAQKDGKLEAISTPNQNSPLSYGYTPILGVDVWEHAYYLKYQNRRADYIKAWWNVVNWQKASDNYDSSK